MTTSQGRNRGTGSSDAPAGTTGIGRYLVRPDTEGPRVRLGIMWFLVALGAIAFGRWAAAAVWAALAASAAWQTTRAWARVLPPGTLVTWACGGAAIGAAVTVVGAGFGTAVAGLIMIVMPLALAVSTTLTGRKPVAAGAPIIGSVLAAIPAVAVVIVVRTEPWAGLFLVVAVSFYDAGFFSGAAESSSRLEGPVTGIIGLLAVTFTASALEAAPFNRATAWIAGCALAVACPLGQMIVSSQLPVPGAPAPSLRRLDSYLLAAPLMLLAVFTLR